MAEDPRDRSSGDPWSPPPKTNPAIPPRVRSVLRKVRTVRTRLRHRTKSKPS